MSRRGVLRARLLVLWSLAALALPCVARAAEEPPVSATRTPGIPLNAAEFPGNVTTLDEQTIARSGATTIPELLGRFEGITVMDTNGFGLGAETGVNIRGLVNSSRTGALVLVDGVKQNRITGDEVLWQSVPLDQVSRIEIIRGGGGLGYGEGALSGVINIITKRQAQKRLDTEERFELGTFGQRTYAVNARGLSGPLNYGAGIHRREVTGYRESTNSRTVTTTSRVGLDLSPELSLDAQLLHTEDTSYFAGGITPEQSQARRRQKGAFNGFFDSDTTQVSLDTQFHSPWGVSIGLSGFARQRESDASVADSRFATITPSEGVSLRTSHDADLIGIRHSVVASLDVLEEKASTGSRGGSNFAESNKSSVGLWFEDTLRLFDRATLMTGVRFDASRFREDLDFPRFEGALRFKGLSPMAGISLDVFTPFTVYANYARPFKAPNVDDFSAVLPNSFVGNVNLQPQQGDAYEIGVRITHPHVGAVKAAWFYNLLDNEILFNAADFQSQNFNTRRVGVETSWEARSPIPHLTGRATYTFINAEFRKGAFAGHKIPGTPEHRVTAGLAYEPIPRLSCTLDWIYVRDFFRINDFANALPGHGYGTLDAGVELLYDHYSIYLKVFNATNTEYSSFQSSNGLAISTGDNPAPPASFLIGMKLRF